MSRPYRFAIDFTPLDPHTGCREREAAAIRAAVLAERERCAAQADRMFVHDERTTAAAVARAIREAPPPQDGT